MDSPMSSSVYVYMKKVLQQQFTIATVSGKLRRKSRYLDKYESTMGSKQREHVSLMEQ